MNSITIHSIGSQLIRLLCNCDETMFALQQDKNELCAYFDLSGLAEHTLTLLRFLLPSVVSSVDEATSSRCNLARQPHTKEKAIEYTDGVMVRERGEGHREERREGGEEVKAVVCMSLLLLLHITPCIGLYGESNVLYLI